MRRDVEREAERLAAKKKADRYISRSGGPPSLREAQRAAETQDLAEDDRKHLQWCLGMMRRLVGNLGDKDQRAAFDFVAAVLERDYGLGLKK